SEFIRQVFERYGGKTNAFVISNGVSSDFRPMEVPRPAEFEGKQVILFTGRYSKEKSHRILIDAVKRCRHAKTVQLVFAGEGPLKEKLIKRAEGLENPPVFRFFSREDMVRMINTADLYVHPAEIEIEAISCLEAISCGLVPVISNSPRSATRYFALDEKNLFVCNNRRDLADKIDYWLDHPDEKAARSKEYLGYTKQFDFDVCMDRMEQMIISTHEQRRK
ncbi:MAG: glycosyltransferase, partial [Clostridia bacterium]|nr:glycosyltransferase [Clostridia bacterium]